MTYEEDPIENALIYIAQAETSCVDCGDFHLRSVLRRVDIATNEKTGDLEEFNAVTLLALQRLSQALPMMRVGIVGSTDTGLLANLLSLADGIGGSALVHKLDIELMDRCATPLAICQAFADRCSVSIKTRQSDFLEISRRDQFDLILMHGVVPFFPADRRQDYLKHIAGWLSEEGILISSTHLGTKPYQNTDTVRTQMAIESLRELAKNRLILDASTLDGLVKRLEKGSETRSVETTVFPDIESAVEAYTAASLEVTSHWIVQLNSGKATQHYRRYKHRNIVVCRRKA